MTLPRTLRDSEVLLLGAVAAGFTTPPTAAHWAGLSRTRAACVLRTLNAFGLLSEAPTGHARRPGRPSVARALTPEGHATLAAYRRARPALFVGRA